VTPSEQGRRNNEAGKRAEQEVARYLTGVTGEFVTSARNVSGGRQRGSDLVTLTDHEVLFTVHGWSIEVKYEAKEARTRWCKQAKKDAPGRLWAVVWKRPNRPIEQAHVYLPAGAFVWWRQAVSVDVSGPVVVDLRAFGLMLSMEPWEGVA
jgi:hypothetical protein